MKVFLSFVTQETLDLCNKQCLIYDRVLKESQVAFHCQRVAMCLAKKTAGTSSEARQRSCLKCRRTFSSAGIHHRICRTCKRARPPDEAAQDEQFESEASRIRRLQGLRRLMGLPLRRQGLARFFVGVSHRFDTCQWIDGEPTSDESCKCGRAVRPGSAYCEGHAERTRLYRRRSSAPPAEVNASRPSAFCPTAIPPQDRGSPAAQRRLAGGDSLPVQKGVKERKSFR